MLKLKPLALIGAIALLSSCSHGRPQNPTQSSAGALTTMASSSQSFRYDDYATVLRTYVNAQGLVNYEALQANPAKLKTFVMALGEVTPETYHRWTEPEKIAFLINAYNAITLASIIEQQPLKSSIKDIWGVWNLKTHKVAGQSKTLDNIEHQILRKEFNEPRIHAALVCAAISCPPLRPEPYTAAQLNTQLDDQVQNWLASPHGLKIDREKNRVAISAIFKWFGEDWQPRFSATEKFTGSDKERAVLNFMSHYLNPADREYLAQGNYKIDYLNYNWSLNRQ